MATYKIVRHWLDRNWKPRAIKTGLTKAQADAHVASPEARSETATRYARKESTRKMGRWCDIAYEE